MKYYRRYWFPVIRRLAFSLGQSESLLVHRNVETREGVADDIYSATREALKVSASLER